MPITLDLEEVVAAAAEAPPLTLGKPADKKKILVVDKDRKYAGFYSKHLGDDYLVIEQPTHSIAESTINHQQPIDLIILEYARFGDLDADYKDVISKARRKNPDTRFLLVSKNDSQYIKAKVLPSYMHQGVNIGYLKKPFNQIELKAKVGSIMNR